MRTLVHPRGSGRATDLWLDDKLVEMGLRLIVNRYNAEDGKEGPGPRVALLSSFFFTRLTQNLKGYDYEGVRRWTTRKGVSIDAVDVILVPIHSKDHWALGVVYPRQHTIEAFDSLTPGGALSRLFCNTMRRWLKDEIKAKGITALDPRRFRFVLPKNIPTQQNGFDCGMFVLIFAAQIASGRTIAGGSLSTARVQHLRSRFIVSLLGSYRTDHFIAL